MRKPVLPLNQEEKDWIAEGSLMRKPVLPLNQEEKDWIAEGIKNSGLEKVDMSKFA